MPKSQRKSTVTLNALIWTRDQGWTAAVRLTKSILGRVLTLVSLTKEQAVVTLKKREEAFAISLKKNSAADLTARVAFVVDQSGSARPYYKNGVIQQAVERLLPVALRLDDNRELDMWLFASGSKAYKRLPSITEQDFYQYVDREIMGKKENQIWGGTEYEPVMSDVIRKYIEEDPSPVPALVIFLTDGANSDRNATKKTLIEASKHGIFWQFIGLGKEEFPFLERLDELKNRFIDNANFFSINDLDELNDEELYDRLMNEYPQWREEAKAKGIF